MQVKKWMEYNSTFSKNQGEAESYLLSGSRMENKGKWMRKKMEEENN